MKNESSIESDDKGDITTRDKNKAHHIPDLVIGDIDELIFPDDDVPYISQR